jgi:hypothetical protein
VNKGVPEKEVFPKYCPDKPPLVNPPPFGRLLLSTAKSPRYFDGPEGGGGDVAQEVHAGEGSSPVRIGRDGLEGAAD